MKYGKFLCGLAAAALVSGGCADRRHSIETDPMAIAAVRAELRLVNGETTWVTRGLGYELVGRSKSDSSYPPRGWSAKPR